MKYHLPPEIYNEKGLFRKAGFEIEFSGIPIHQSSELIKGHFGGNVIQDNYFSCTIADTSLGDFKVKLDTSLFEHPQYQKALSKVSSSAREIFRQEKSMEARINKILGDIAATLIPYEIVTPPLPVKELDRLEDLRWLLYRNKAKGTGSALMYAFATHINAEAHSFSPESILNHLRAFIVMYPYILHKQDINLARRMSYFINPFQWKFIKLILNPRFNQTLEDFILLYYTYNPDRNRPLDLFPLFAHLKPELVTSFKHIGNVKARPTYHYRLPNSLIDEKDWSFAHEWNMWVEIEKLALNDSLLMDLCLRYSALKRRSLFGIHQKWAGIMEKKQLT